jgi:hypothetical protein
MAETVTVALAMPNGLQAEVGEQKIVFNGWNKNLIAGSTHGITEDVPKEFWDKWLAENQWQDLVKNNLIFAHEKQRNLKAEIKDNVGNKSGTEQLNPEEMGKDNGKD